MAKPQEDRIAEDIRNHFGFLLDKGYGIREVRFFPESFGNWYVLLEASNYFIRINCDRSEISVMFDPEKANSRNQIGLGTLIYYLSKGKHFVGYYDGNASWGKKKQLERLASLLNEYHDQIARLFETNLQTLREDLALSQRKYGELLQGDYSRKFAAGEKVWKGLNLFAVPFKLIGLGFLAYLGWGVSILFMTATDIGLKLLYGSIAATIIVMLAVLALRFLKDLQR